MAQAATPAGRSGHAPTGAAAAETGAATTGRESAAVAAAAAAAAETLPEVISSACQAAERGGGEKDQVLFHPDQRHVETCPHCGIVFCSACDVRDKKRAFPFLLENDPGGKKEEERRAADPSAIEAGNAKKVRSTSSPACV